MGKKKFNQFSYQNDFISKNYDRVNLTVPKGKKEKIREAAKAEGKSVNEFINAAIDARMSGTGAPVQQQEPPAEVKKTPEPKKAAGQQAPEEEGVRIGEVKLYERKQRRRNWADIKKTIQEGNAAEMLPGTEICFTLKDGRPAKAVVIGINHYNQRDAVFSSGGAVDVRKNEQRTHQRGRVA